MNTAWEDAVTRGDLTLVGRLIESGADIDARDGYGQTALMLAAHKGYLDVVETLIAHGADLNVRAKYNLSALMLAVVAGRSEIASLLARAGADLSIRGAGAPGFHQKTAYDLAIEREMTDLCEELRPK